MRDDQNVAKLAHLARSADVYVWSRDAWPVMSEPMQDLPRRLTPTEQRLQTEARLHEVTIAAMSRRPSEPESSVTITRNARGVFQFEVTVRGGDASECSEEAHTIALWLVNKYPYPNGDGE